MKVYLSKIKIRKAKQSDINKVWKMSDVPGLENPDKKPPRIFWIKAFLKRNQPFFIAEYNKRIIGFIFGERTVGNVAILQEIEVKKEYRNHGIGHLLLKEFEKECKKRKIVAILDYAYSKSKMPEIFKKSGYSLGSLDFEVLKFLNKEH